MAPQTTYNLVPAVGVHGMLAASREGTVIRPFLAQGLVPVGYLCAPGTGNFVGPPLTTVIPASTSPGQVKALPAGITDDPILNSQFLGVPIYESTHPPYDGTLGYACYDNQTTVPVLTRGPIFVAVESGSAPVEEGNVYVRVAASGANVILGAWASAPGTGLVRLARAQFNSGLIQGSYAWINIGI